MCKYLTIKPNHQKEATALINKLLNSNNLAVKQYLDPNHAIEKNKRDFVNNKNDIHLHRPDLLKNKYPHFLNSEQALKYFKFDIEEDHYLIGYYNDSRSELADDTGKTQAKFKHEITKIKHQMIYTKKYPHSYWYTYYAHLPETNKGINGGGKPYDFYNFDANFNDYYRVAPCLVNLPLALKIKNHIIKNFQKNIKHLQTYLANGLTTREKVFLVKLLMNSNNEVMNRMISIKLGLVKYRK